MKNILTILSITLITFSASAQSANVQTAIDGYNKFGAGDIPGILASLDANIVWSHDGDPALIPFAGTFKGQAEVGRFFENVGKSVKVTVFNPTNFREQGNQVINDTHIEGVLLATGKTYVDDVVMTWTFGPDGKVIAWEAKGPMTGISAAARK
ncbi:MAG: nuclear transport factor 2 family protein [Saprospiraceae bacterium]|nr:nuclear transport factor 2 family protein [Saprospiraceae bacterium]